MKLIYRTEASADGGRAGKVVNEEAGLSLDLAIPGSGAAGNNPEQLFAMGYAACFDSALKLCAKKERSAMTGSRTTAAVGLGQLEGGGYGLDVELRVAVKGVAHAEAERLVALAHELCPYSAALKGNMAVRLLVSAE
ncbi:MAG TPA: Ohr family peroxiredoxin [Spirochaetia bacterium]|nr:Ohr family peroxiredoxin [Spirochaetia bacterium]HRZ64845.1 Ohr family peroxiredoxin [Spirochaetia bacterium]